MGKTLMESAMIFGICTMYSIITWMGIFTKENQ